MWNINTVTSLWLFFILYEDPWLKALFVSSFLSRRRKFYLWRTNPTSKLGFELCCHCQSKMVIARSTNYLQKRKVRVLTYANFFFSFKYYISFQDYVTAYEPYQLPPERGEKNDVIFRNFSMAGKVETYTMDNVWGTHEVANDMRRNPDAAPFPSSYKGVCATENLVLLVLKTSTDAMAESTYLYLIFFTCVRLNLAWWRKNKWEWLL